MYTQFFKYSLLFCACVSATLDPIVIKGSKFFYKTSGSQFILKGVAYQQNPGDISASTVDRYYVDSLANPTACKRDIPFLKKLGLNLVRTYSIDPTLNHDACMNMLDEAGIYVISDLAQPNISIVSDGPLWDTTLYQRYISVVDSLAKYPNTIGFFAGNEVSNDVNTTSATAYVKAAVRDTKAYIKQKGYREGLGVGYASKDNKDTQQSVAAYLNCGDDQASTIDFWGYNIYSWCGESNMVNSSYAERTQESAKYSVPVFFSEYGCREVPGWGPARPFTEVKALYGPQMNEVFSGGIAYQYFQNSIDYGLVSVDGESVKPLLAYSALSTQLQAVTVTGINVAKYSATNTARSACPATATSWAVSPKVLPLSPNEPLCSCMLSTLTCQAKPNIPGRVMGAFFEQICGEDATLCKDIAADPKNGTYSTYSMCGATEQLSWAFNAYYLKQGGKSSACDFTGNATIVLGAKPISVCASLATMTTMGAGSASTSTTLALPTLISISTSTTKSSSTSTGTSASTTTAAKSSASAVKVVDVGGMVLSVYLVLMFGAGSLML